MTDETNSAEQPSAAANYAFITWSDTPNSSALEIEALTYDSCSPEGPMSANSFVVIDDAVQKRSWFGQIIEPQRNLPRGLSKDNPNSISALERVLSGTAEETVFLEQYHYYRIKLIGEITKGYLESVRVRPRYGAKGRKATQDEVVKYVRFPDLAGEGLLNNAIGVIKDSDILVCMDQRRFFYHMLIAGATGGGKTNNIGQNIKAAQSMGMAVIVIDHKPDYQDVHRSNTEANLFEGFDSTVFGAFGLEPVNYFCLYSGKDDTRSAAEKAIAIRASDASHEMLATALFYRHGEELQREAFFNMLGHFQEHLKEKRSKHKQEEARKAPITWTLDEFSIWVNSHRKVDSKGKVDWSQLAEYFNDETPNEKVIKAMLTRIGTRKPEWMDIKKKEEPIKTGVFKDMPEDDDEPTRCDARYFDPKGYLRPGQVLVIRRPHTSDGREYGLFLSYLLRRVYNLRRLNEIGFKVLIVIDEAQDIFSGDSMLRSASERTVNEVLRKGRSKGMGFLISVQSASQLPESILNNLNTRIIHRQNSEDELRHAIPGVPRDMLSQVVNFASGEAIVSMFGVSAPVHAQIAPSPFEITKDEADKNGSSKQKPSKKGSNQFESGTDEDAHPPF